MLQPTQLNRWSQVTIYAKPSTYSIGLALEGVARLQTRARPHV
jgi:hypothetical protein